MRLSLLSLRTGGALTRATLPGRCRSTVPQKAVQTAWFFIVPWSGLLRRERPRLGTLPDRSSTAPRHSGTLQGAQRAPHRHPL